jgi:chorismate mutase
MNPALRHQLRTLDRALLALVDERARLLGEVPADDPGRLTAIEDLLRRHAGPLPAASTRELFTLLDRHCAPFFEPGDAR